MRVPKKMMMQMGGITPYSQKIIGMFGANLIGYWPLDEAAGLSADDKSTTGLDLTYLNVTLGQPGIGDGKTCPSYNGVNSRTSGQSAGMDALFNKSEGSMFIWGKVSGAGVWTDGGIRNFMNITDGVGKHYEIVKEWTNNQITFRAEVKSYQVAASSTAWVSYGLTWSIVNNAVIGYVNGIAITPQTKQGVTYGANAYIGIGTLGAGAAFIFSGWLAHGILLNRPATAAEALKVATL